MFGDLGGFFKKILCWDITLFLKKICLKNNSEVTHEQKTNVLILLVKYSYNVPLFCDCRKLQLVFFYLLLVVFCSLVYNLNLSFLFCPESLIAYL